MTAPSDPDDLNFRVPEVAPPQQGRVLKLALLNAQRTSHLGALLVAAPCLFVFLAFATHMHRGIRLPAFASLEEWMARVDHTSLWFLPPAFLVGLPLIALAINFLAILNLHLDHSRGELQCTIKLRRYNLAIIAICLVILAAIALYVIGENHAAR